MTVDGSTLALTLEKIRRDDEGARRARLSTLVVHRLRALQPSANQRVATVHLIRFISVEGSPQHAERRDSHGTDEDEPVARLGLPRLLSLITTQKGASLGRGHLD